MNDRSEFMALGYSTARRVVKLGRAAFFPDTADLPVRESDTIRLDDLVPQFGFVGARYPTTRVLILSINPGNGPNAVRNHGDEYMMPALHRFAADPSVENYVAGMRAYRAVWKTWAVHDRHCKIVLSAMQFTDDDIAYFPSLPWRTRSKSGFSAAVSRATADNYLAPLLRELQPVEIVALGKKAADVLSLVKGQWPKPVVWDRSQAETAKVREAREGRRLQLVQLGNRVRGDRDGQH